MAATRYNFDGHTGSGRDAMEKYIAAMRGRFDSEAAWQGFASSTRAQHQDESMQVAKSTPLTTPGGGTPSTVTGPPPTIGGVGGGPKPGPTPPPSGGSGGGGGVGSGGGTSPAPTFPLGAPPPTKPVDAQGSGSPALDGLASLLGGGGSGGGGMSAAMPTPGALKALGNRILPVDMGPLAGRKVY